MRKYLVNLDMKTQKHYYYLNFVLQKQKDIHKKPKSKQKKYSKDLLKEYSLRWSFVEKTFSNVVNLQKQKKLILQLCHQKSETVIEITRSKDRKQHLTLMVNENIEFLVRVFLVKIWKFSWKFKKFRKREISPSPKKYYVTNKTDVFHIGDAWSMDGLDLNDYGALKIKGFRCTLILIDKFFKFVWVVPIKDKTSQTVKDSYENLLISSKRKPNFFEIDDGKVFISKTFHWFVKEK